MMGYQRAADEQAGRQFERGRQIAANLGGGAGLAYMQGVSSNIAGQQRKGLLTDMTMQQRNRADLDQLINMQNQEMAQERAQEQLGYQMAMRDFMDQRSRLQSDVGQQQSNIAASIGGIVGDIPNYATAFRNYNTMRNMASPGTQNQAPAFGNRFLQTGSLTANRGTTPRQAMLSRFQTPTMTQEQDFLVDPRYSMAMGIMPRFYR
jgi:hypothetical protein